MSDPVTQIAEVLNANYGYSEEWNRRVAAVVAARLAEHHAIVELPEAFRPYSVSQLDQLVFPAEVVAFPDRIELDLHSITIEAARELAAALLAAVNAIERTDRV